MLTNQIMISYTWSFCVPDMALFIILFWPKGVSKTFQLWKFTKIMVSLQEHAQKEHCELLASITAMLTTALSQRTKLVSCSLVD
jgi:hypothetical protein